MQAEQSNLRFADGIDGLAGEEEEPIKLVERFDKASTAYGMEISAENAKLMTNNTSCINKEIKVSGQKLEIVTSFKYVGSVVSGEGSEPEVVSRIEQTTAALTRLNKFGTTGALLSVPRYDLCVPLLHPSSCMLVKHRPSHQSCKEEYEPWK